jgi:hypothetical protein
VAFRLVFRLLMVVEVTAAVGMVAALGVSLLLDFEAL